MKWEWGVQELREVVAKDGRIDGDIVEALRAIAEQLERLADRLDVHGSNSAQSLEQIRDALEKLEQHRHLDDAP